MQSDSVDDLKRAKKIFTTLSCYKFSKNNIVFCDDKISGIEAEELEKVNASKEGNFWNSKFAIFFELLGLVGLMVIFFFSKANVFNKNGTKETAERIKQQEYTKENYEVTTEVSTEFTSKKIEEKTTKSVSIPQVELAETVEESITEKQEKDGNSQAEIEVKVQAEESMPSEKTVKKGDYILFGRYYDEQILWRCIDIDENGLLMLSDKILCIKPFDAAGINTSGSHGRGYDSGSGRQELGSNYWNDSNIKDWLNSDASAGNVIWSCGNPPDKEHVRDGFNAYDKEAGFLNGFTQAEKSAIKTVTQKQLLDSYEYSPTGNENYYFALGDINNVLANYDTAYSEITTDKVFLLDVKQVFNLYRDFGDYYMASPTLKAVENSGYITDYVSYWLRSPEATGDFDGSSVIDVSPDGHVYKSFAYSGFGYSGEGVRPAFYLNSSISHPVSGIGTESDPFIFRM